MTDEYYAGKGCTCYAYSEGECCCDVDWTEPEIYKLREQVKEYAGVAYQLLGGDTAAMDDLYDMLREDKFIDDCDEWIEDDT